MYFLLAKIEQLDLMRALEIRNLGIQGLNSVPTDF